jgi:hypothetical protein
MPDAGVGSFRAQALHRVHHRCFQGLVTDRDQGDQEHARSGDIQGSERFVAEQVAQSHFEIIPDHKKKFYRQAFPARRKRFRYMTKNNETPPPCLSGDCFFRREYGLFVFDTRLCVFLQFKTFSLYLNSFVSFISPALKKFNEEICSVWLWAYCP